MRETINYEIFNVENDRASEIREHVSNGFHTYMNDESIDEDQKNWSGFYEAKLRDYPTNDSERHFMNFTFGQMVVIFNQPANPLERLLQQLGGDGDNE